jgi:hypothetical protein
VPSSNGSNANAGAAAGKGSNNGDSKDSSKENKAQALYKKISGADVKVAAQEKARSVNTFAALMDAADE